MIVTATDIAYPAVLRDLSDPPSVLHLRGERDRLGALLAPPAVAIVGPRRPTEAARAFAERLGRDLAAAGVGIVSGLAAGVDAAAHAGALAAGGRTVAVLGCGVDIDYPIGNRRLAAAIAAHGAIVSEYGPGTPPAPWRFPARNRIVAALASTTCVVEASRRSGALITARLALDLGRDVYATPATPWLGVGHGGNDLLRDGAGLLTGAADVLVGLGIDPGAVDAPSEVDMSADASALLRTIRRHPATPLGLMRALGWSAGRFGAALADLEIAGLVTRERDGSLVA